MTMPVVYIPHGGGPLPLLGDPSHQSLIDFLQGLGPVLPKPVAIVVISAHWESAPVSIMASEAPGMLFDYYGFPPESYEYGYPAPGAPDLAATIRGLLTQAGIAATLDEERGFDHGVFVPLLLMYPEAQIPVVQLSLLSGLDAEQHIALGEALSELRTMNVLILGSGMSFHNMRALMAGESPEFSVRSDAFHDWLVQTCTSDSLHREERKQELLYWHRAPGGMFSHPRPEHLLPLHVCFGAAKDSGQASLIYDQALMGHKVAGFRWD